MSLPPPIEIWVVEGQADLLDSRGSVTRGLVGDWQAAAGVEGEVSYSTDHQDGPRGRDDYDYVILPGATGQARAKALADLLASTFGLRLYVRHALLVAFPQYDADSSRRTGASVYQDPVRRIRAFGRWDPDGRPPDSE